MNREIKFSICIPNYNYAHYVVETIQTVLDQDYENFEILVADNASTDNSVSLIRAIGDPRIQVHVNRFNIGFAPNLDKATYGHESKDLFSSKIDGPFSSSYLKLEDTMLSHLILGKLWFQFIELL